MNMLILNPGMKDVLPIKKVSANESFLSSDPRHVALHSESSDQDMTD